MFGGSSLDGVGVAAAANKKEDEADDASEDQNGTGEHGEAEAAREDGAISGYGGTGGDVAGAEGGGEISADVIVFAEPEGAEEDGNISGDGAAGGGGDGSEDDGDVAMDIAGEVDGAEGAGDVAGGVALVDVDGGEDGDAVVGIAGAEEREEEDGGEKKF